MNSTKSVLIKIIIMVVVCWYVVSCTVGSSKQPKKVLIDETFGLQTDVDGRFPVDNEGNIVFLMDLSAEELDILYEKIKSKNPYVESNKRASMAWTTHKFMGISEYGELSHVGLNCHNPYIGRMKVVLVVDGAQRGSNAQRVMDAWKNFGAIYNSELLETAGNYSLNGCLKGYDFIDGNLERQK